ncbi:MAG: EVE domain-containing protein, partial [bacterium]|nr:EVE domain-containing protein [bacterium]
ADFTFLARLEPPTTLKEIKQEGRFKDWALVRQGRLSTMAAPPDFVTWIRQRYQGVEI